MILHGIKRGFFRDAEFTAWTSPDEISAGVASGAWDLFVAPSQLAASLYNRGQGVRLLNVMTDGLLSVAARDPDLSGVGALKGRILSAPREDDASSVLLRALLALYDLDPKRDVSILYGASPMESAQLLATGRVDAIVLPEPVMTVLEEKTAKAEKPVIRAIDMRKAWSEKVGRSVSLPQAGLGVSRNFWEKYEGMARDAQKSLADAADSAQKNPDLAGDDTASFFGLSAGTIAKSVSHMNLTGRRAVDARADLEAFYRAILEDDPNIIGGGLPDQDFYL
ncbi:nitrate ABC transporter substrate-binding protein [Alphaproteobacteria bacterium]|nr:nitrate ABC transporter substrate-binding protein [Alphaproteobacteria bacterium]